IWGIVLEFFHPGSLLPGIVGGICLILAFFALQILSFNMAGLVLIFLAVVLFVLDITVPSYGALTIGGIVSLALGSLMLIDPSAIYISISLEYIVIMVAFTSALFIFIVSYAIKAQFKKPATGVEGMVGSTGITRSNLKTKGKIRIHGEIWNAILESSGEVIRKGEEVEVVRVEGMRLVVKKKGG
ncbi:MAG: NfeD family protein, partial [Candidatus Aerophobetes bacterium]